MRGTWVEADGGPIGVDPAVERGSLIGEKGRLSRRPPLASHWVRPGTKRPQDVGSDGFIFHRVVAAMTALRVLAALHLNRLSSPPEDVEEVMDLLDEDTEINAHYVDPHKRTLLHIVLADEDPKCKETMREKLVWRLLLEGVDPSWEDCFGHTCYDYALHQLQQATDDILAYALWRHFLGILFLFEERPTRYPEARERAKLDVSQVQRLRLWVLRHRKRRRR